jgi:hypothetical protein
MVALPSRDAPLATLVCREDVPLVVDRAGERTAADGATLFVPAPARERCASATP